MTQMITIPEPDTELLPLRVLVVDDNVPSAQTLEWTIETYGDDVRSCHDGRTALREAHDFRPDVILLDLAMPGMDGIEVCRQLRKDSSLAGVKIIAQTGHSDPEHRRMTAAAGFDLHLVKPVDPHVLADMLHLLRTNPLRRHR